MVATVPSSKRIDYMDEDHQQAIKTSLVLQHPDLKRSEVTLIEFKYGSYHIKVKGAMTTFIVPYSKIEHIDIKLPNFILIDDGSRQITSWNDMETALNDMFHKYGATHRDQISFMAMSYGDVVQLHQYFDKRLTHEGYKLGFRG